MVIQEDEHEAEEQLEEVAMLTVERASDDVLAANPPKEVAKVALHSMLVLALLRLLSLKALLVLQKSCWLIVVPLIISLLSS